MSSRTAPYQTAPSAADPRAHVARERVRSTGSLRSELCSESRDSSQSARRLDGCPEGGEQERAQDELVMTSHPVCASSSTGAQRGPLVVSVMRCVSPSPISTRRHPLRVRMLRRPRENHAPKPYVSDTTGQDRSRTARPRCIRRAKSRPSQALARFRETITTRRPRLAGTWGPARADAPVRPLVSRPRYPSIVLDEVGRDVRDVTAVERTRAGGAAGLLRRVTARRARALGVRR